MISVQTLLTLVCDPAKSGIKYDLRLSYYTKVAEYANIYAMPHLKWGGNYDRKFTPSLPKEHVHLNVIVRCDSNDNILDN